MAKFICKRKCQYAGSIYGVGATVEVDAIVDCPACKGRGCDKCRGTGRLYPPHHFEQVGGVKKPEVIVDAPPAPVMSLREEDETIESMRKKYEEDGLAYDRRWKLKKLQDEYKKAKKEGR